MKKLKLVFISLILMSCYSASNKKIVLCEKDLPIEKYYHNDMYLDETLGNCLRPMLDEAFAILKEIEDIEVKKIHQRYNSSVNKSRITEEEIHKKLKWASSFIKENGDLPLEKIKLSSQWPIFELGNHDSHNITFSFNYYNKELLFDDRIWVKFVLDNINGEFEFQLQDIMFVSATFTKRLLEIGGPKNNKK